MLDEPRPPAVRITSAAATIIWLIWWLVLGRNRSTAEGVTPGLNRAVVLADPGRFCASRAQLDLHGDDARLRSARDLCCSTLGRRAGRSGTGRVNSREIASSPVKVIVRKADTPAWVRKVSAVLLFKRFELRSGASAGRQAAPQPWMTAPQTRLVLDALGREGTEVRFIGGCVRDAVLKRPVRDIDLALPLSPQRVMTLLRRANIKAIPTGIDHGTVTAVVDAMQFEITTLRMDVENYGRRAKVAFIDDWSADAARRDFTFNALSCTPDGDIYDYFGGLEDLGHGRVRFVGSARERIAEDVLRLLRFFRFYAYYGRPPPDEEALSACREWAERVQTLSGERVRVELFRTLMATDPADVFQLMRDGECSSMSCRRRTK